MEALWAWLYKISGQFTYYRNKISRHQFSYFYFIKIHSMEHLELDATDLRLLDELQRDANPEQPGAGRVGAVSPPPAPRQTAERRRADRSGRWPSLSDDRLPLLGQWPDGDCGDHARPPGRRNCWTRLRPASGADAAVQCYRVSPGPDFVLVVFARHAGLPCPLAQRLFGVMRTCATSRRSSAKHRAVPAVVRIARRSTVNSIRSPRACPELVEGVDEERDVYGPCSRCRWKFRCFPNPSTNCFCR